MGLREVNKYSITVINGVKEVSDLLESHEVLATTLTGVSELTGISRDRLAYLFTRKRKVAVIERNYLIRRIYSEYVGKVRGDNRYMGYNRNR